jgi:sec-independent protein translocase protein TatA
MLFPGIGLPELIIILVIVLLIFGVGRLGKLGGEFGRGIREFKKATQEDPTEEEKKALAEQSQSDTKPS